MSKHNPNYIPDATAAASSSKPSEAMEPKLFKWADGSYHPLPEKYILTCRGDVDKPGEELKQARTPLQAYMCWNLPNLRTGICAIRNCCPEDFSIRNQRKRFSDWTRFVKGWHRIILLSGQKIMDGRKPGTEAQWQKQFQKGFYVYVTLCKFLHPSRRKRKRIRSNPSIAMSYKISTVLTDLSVLKNMLYKIKCFFARLKIEGFVRHYCGTGRGEFPKPRLDQSLPENEFTIERYLELYNTA